MRVAYIVPGFSAHESDPCIPVLRDVLERVRRSADVHVLALRYPAPGRRYTVGGIHVHALGGDERGGFARAPLLLSALLALRSAHRRRPFDVVHGLWADEPGAVAVSAGRLLGIPSVVSLMGGERVALPTLGYGGALSSANRVLCRYALRHGDVVTAANAGDGADIRSAGISRPVSGARRLIWGVEPGAFTRPPQQQLPLAGDFRVMHVGSLVPVKGIDILLRAASRAARLVPGLHVHLVGDGPERPALLALEARLGMHEHVTFHGQIPRERLGEFYRAANVLCVSSWHEMQPLVALEAGLFGLPVVGTTVGLLPDLISEGVLTAPPGDVDALASVLVEIAGDDRRGRRDAALQSRVQSQYLAEHTANQLLRTYTELQRRCVGRGLQRRPASTTLTPLLDSEHLRVCAGDPYGLADEKAVRTGTGLDDGLSGSSIETRLSVTTTVVNDVSDA